MRERYGLQIVVHPHADTHIDSEENVVRFLNYGHGGAGVTLSWGCAREVAQLLAEASSGTP